MASSTTSTVSSLRVSATATASFSSTVTLSTVGAGSTAASGMAAALGIGIEKPAILLQIGAAYTKAGFSGEHIPRCVVPSTVWRKGKSVRVLSQQLWSDEAELRDVLIDFLFEILYQRLLVKAHDRRIVVVEDLLTPAVFRETLASVLLLHYQATSIAFLPTYDAVLYPLAGSSALVVDVGLGEASVMGVHAFHAIRRSFECTGKGAAALFARIREAVAAIDASVELTDAQVEDIAVRACIALPPPEGVSISTVAYPLGQGRTVGLDASVRIDAANVLFDDDEAGDSLQRLILDALNRCPIDTRKDLASNIVLLGGVCQLPGFQRRLLQELATLSEAPEYAKLRGTLVTRYITTVTLEAEGLASLDIGTLNEVSGKIKMDVLGAVPETAAIDDCTVDLAEGLRLTAKIQTMDAWDTTALQTLQLTGKVMFRVISVAQAPIEGNRGVAASFAIHDLPFAPNITAWVGGAIYGALEGLATRSVTQDAFRQNQKLPDWAVIPDPPPAPKPEDAEDDGRPADTPLAAAATSVFLRAGLA